MVKELGMMARYEAKERMRARNAVPASDQGRISWSTGRFLASGHAFVFRERKSDGRELWLPGTSTKGPEIAIHV